MRFFMVFKKYIIISVSLLFSLSNYSILVNVFKKEVDDLCC